MRKLLLLVIITVVILCCIFPPWQRIYKERNSNIKKIEPVGYSFIAEPPVVQVKIYDKFGRVKDYEFLKADAIDFGRLTVQLALLLFLGMIIVFSRHIFPPKPPLPDNALPEKRRWIAKTLACLLLVILTGYGITVTILWNDADWQQNYFREQYNVEQKKAKVAQDGADRLEKFLIEYHRIVRATYAEHGIDKPAPAPRGQGSPDKLLQLFEAFDKGEPLPGTK